MKNSFKLISYVLLFHAFFMPSLHSKLHEKKTVFTTSASFMGCNPLKGIQSIAIYPFYATNNPSLRSHLYKQIISTLQEVGDVKILKFDESFDVKGFSQSQAQMVLLLSRACNTKGKELPITKLSLWIVSETIIETTKQPCRNPIWFLDTYLDTPFDKREDEKIIEVFMEVCKKFISDYQGANEGAKKTPTFYVYQIHNETD